MAQTLTTRNKQTGAVETIAQRELATEDWGFRFFVETESDAYKAAYLYRHNPFGVLVEFAGGAREWMVTVFNQRAVELGLEGTRKAA